MLRAPRCQRPGNSLACGGYFSGFVNQKSPPLPESGFDGSVDDNGEESGIEIPAKNELTGARSYGLSTRSDPYRERVVHVRRKTKVCRTWGKRHPFQRSRAAWSGR